ncbi:MAG: lipoprotein [Beijerinckiaceae bacterium]|nr:lipoprotein [Beijerinckiaceae bacterium]MCI0735713.1 lipoprotein [Beijerinckiaceae bacterium]
MSVNVPKFAVTLVVATVALSLATCGRRGPLDAPPGGSIASAPLTGTPGDYQTSGTGELTSQTPVNSTGTPPPESPAPGPKMPPPRPFFLDPLL